MVRHQVLRGVVLDRTNGCTRAFRFNEKLWSRNSSFFLALPKENNFIPSHFNIKDNATELKYPQLLVKSKDVEVWHKLDISFNKPVANWEISLLSPVAYESPEGSLLARFIAEVLVVRVRTDLIGCSPNQCRRNCTLPDWPVSPSRLSARRLDFKYFLSHVHPWRSLSPDLMRSRECFWRKCSRH